MNELFDKFKALGWNDDKQSLNTFELLKTAHNEVAPNSILLDLGAGQCRYKFFFDHCHYISVDYGVGAGAENPHLDFVGDVMNLDFIRSASIDYTLNTTTLEHIANPFIFFTEIERILKHGGKLYLYVPFVYEEHGQPYDFFRPTSFGLRQLCETVGLEVISILPTTGPLYSIGLWASIILDRAKAASLFDKMLLSVLRFSTKHFIIPLFVRIDTLQTGTILPISWTLIAQKPGELIPSAYTTKDEAIAAIRA